MDKVAFSHKNRFRIILFVIFSVVFILSGIPGVYRESVLFGTGYFMSNTFLITLLSFVPFILCTLYFFLVARRKYVLLLDEKGILDKRYLFGKVFIPWERIASIDLNRDKRSECLLIKIGKNVKMDADYVIDQDVITYKIPLKYIDYNESELKGVLLYYIPAKPTL
ncbi:hypothetical protein [Sphingobacterium tabacisoli]|uniref:PH domain-containing protein n=1 Tax=Sphingobacterium tabacisoli TaxID=2044855 RepID=A0ABW5LBK4_9SPHI|nr:hypothetical protein [Sphingobacterium tabacisoli]